MLPYLNAKIYWLLPYSEILQLWSCYPARMLPSWPWRIGLLLFLRRQQQWWHGDDYNGRAMFIFSAVILGQIHIIPLRLSKKTCIRQPSTVVMLYLAQSLALLIAECKYFDCTQYSFWQCYVCLSNLAVYILQPKIAIDLILYSSMSVNVICTVVVCDNHYQITVAQVKQPMTVNWL